MLHTMRVASRIGDPKGRSVLDDIKRLKLGSFDSVRTARVYRFEGLTDADAKCFAEHLVDVDQDYTLDAPLLSGAKACREVSYVPGMMNPEASSLMKMGRDLGLTSLIAADSSIEYHFDGAFAPEELDTVLNRLLVNPTTQAVIDAAPETLVIKGQRGPVRFVPIRSFSDEQLLEYSVLGKLHLNLEEMRVLQDQARTLNRDLRHAEIEIPAQTWSEHCGHKSFKALLLVNGKEKKPLIKRIMDTAALHFKGMVVSAFVDNSGVMLFYDGWSICIKFETHNAPSAVDPYGGAMTGVGGDLRDIDGTGQGARVIAAADVLCFGPPDLPPDQLPPGCIHPEHLLRKVVEGIRDYGNRMGVPTNNGSLYFHEDYRAKPVVLVGAIGILPTDKAKKGEPQPGDVILLLGGRTGRDGIHGATFSSGAMTDQTATLNSQSVQIGNAIEEKRTFDVGHAFRDRGYVRAKTDCGAGGLSSAVNEMGKDTGAHLRLETVPLKYSGLDSSEITISESQERMVYAMDPAYVADAIALAAEHNVEATVIGEFTGTGQFLVTFDEEIVCDLSMDFLHNGLPQRVMHACWEPTMFEEPSADVIRKDGFAEQFGQVMEDLDVCCKEPIVRQFDHTVQGTSALTPFSGVHNDGPNDAAVIRPLLDKPYGVVYAHGMNPILNRIDPYQGGLWAGVEAISNLVAAGGNFRESVLVDNFIWPVPDEESMGSLDRAVDACCTLMDTFGIPFISGKDSLGGTYQNKDKSLTIKVLPVLCISAMGRIPDVTKTASADFKRIGSNIFLVGNPDFGALGGSTFYRTLGFVGNRLPKLDLANQPAVYDIINRWIDDGTALAVHDVSQAGIGGAVAEMCFGGDIGAHLFLDTLGDQDARDLLFTEAAGCFIVEVAQDRVDLVGNPPPFARFIGTTTLHKVIVGHRISATHQDTFRVPTDPLKKRWQKRMQEIFQ